MVVGINKDGRNLLGFQETEFTDKDILDENNYINNSAAADLFEYAAGVLITPTDKKQFCLPRIEIKNNEYITRDEAIAIFEEQGDLKYGTYYRKFNKEAYKLVDMNSLVEFTNKIDISNRMYIRQSSHGNYYDYSCRGFAFDYLFESRRWDAELAIAYVSGLMHCDESDSYHAFNAFIDTNRDLYIVEPQSRIQIMKAVDEYDYCQIRQIIM